MLSFLIPATLVAYLAAPDDAQDADAYAALLTLKEGEVLRRIPLGVAGRAAFLKRQVPDEDPGLLKRPSSMVFQFDSGSFKTAAIYHHGDDGPPHRNFIAGILKLPLTRIVGDPALLGKKANADYVVRKGAERAALADALATSLSEQLDPKVTLRVEDRKTPALVVTGKFAGATDKDLEIFVESEGADEKRAGTRGGGGQDHMNEALATRLGLPTVNEANGAGKFFRWRFHRDVDAAKADPALRAKLFERLEKLTGLKYSVEERTLTLAVLEPAK
jgi:hypothetical protein